VLLAEAGMTKDGIARNGRQYALAAASAFAGVVAAAFVPIARETPGLTLLAVAITQALTMRLGPALLGIVIAGIGLTIIRTPDSAVAHIVRIAVFVLLAGAVAAVRHGRRRTLEASEQYQMLFDRSPMPMWMYDDETLAFLAVNQAAIDTYGYTREEFARMTLRDIRPEEDRAAVARRPAKGLPTYAGTWRHRTRQGRELEVLVRSHLVDNHGRPARLALLEDRTERAGLERQLHHAQKMDAIGQLAGGMAHDFNNLLTAIFGYCDLLLSDIPASDPRRGDIEEIKKAATAAASLTDRLLAFSRKQIIEPKVLDLNGVVGDMGRLLQRVIGEDIEMELNLAPQLGRVKADPHQIGQVLMNLVVNARDAMPQGGKLTITTDNIALDDTYAHMHVGVVPGPHVMLAVSDTGTGMSPEVQSRLFEPFFTTKPAGKGTGLGLASVYGIVKQSGGNVWVYSEVGHGTTFKVYLPLVDATADEAMPAALSPQPAAPPPAMSTNGATILLVEDNPSLEQIARRILKRYGYSVLSAPSAEEAVRVSRGHAGAIDLLLTDVVMPGQSGPSLATLLTTERPAMRVLHMSGYTDDAVVRHGALSGTATFLQKPFTPEGLGRKVREVLSSQLPGVPVE
jgi:two-component system cell cycle sensor histidine kinase/response regulator CckA